MHTCLKLCGAKWYMDSSYGIMWSGFGKQVCLKQWAMLKWVVDINSLVQICIYIHFWHNSKQGLFYASFIHKMHLIWCYGLCWWHFSAYTTKPNFWTFKFACYPRLCTLCWSCIIFQQLTNWIISSLQINRQDIFSTQRLCTPKLKNLNIGFF